MRGLWHGLRKRRISTQFIIILRHDRDERFFGAADAVLSRPILGYVGLVT